MEDLDYAALLKPRHLDTLVNRADLLLERGELERARADIDDGMAIDPLDVHLLTARGSLLAETGDEQAAYASYTAAIEADPAFAAAWANRAILSYSPAASSRRSRILITPSTSTTMQRCASTAPSRSRTSATTAGPSPI